MVGGMAGEFEGRAIAIQRVIARDAQAAASLALRDVQITLECLNCFAAVIPYNHARLQVSQGHVESGASLRLALADEGSIWLAPEASIPWKYSLEALWQLHDLAGAAMNRVDSLLTKGDRTAVDDLLLRAVRCVGRAAAANRTEDKFLYAGIAIDCVVRPVEISPIKKHITERTARVQQDFSATEEMERLYEIRKGIIVNFSRGCISSPRDIRGIARLCIASLGTGPLAHRLRSDRCGS